MRKFSGISFVCIVVILFIIQGGVSSCTKDPEIVTVTEIDTVYVIKQDTLPSAAILSAHSWKVLEERGVNGGSLLYYLRGGTGNTINLDNEFITFNSNNTGTLTIQSGNTYSFTWNFVNSTNTKLTWTVQNSPATYTITWDNIRYKNGNLYMDQYYTDGNNGNHSHTQQIRIPK